MKKIIVNGPARLRGSVKIGGSKNAALPILFACIIAEGVSEIEGLPDIGDVRVAMEILTDMGAEITQNSGVTYVDSRNMHYRAPSEELISKIRASTYLIGACLGRFGRCLLQSYGGCNFSHRPIDMHLYATQALGADKNGDLLCAGKLTGAEISFDKASVGATVNSILLSATAEGKTRIRGVAREPHIDCLIDFLTSCGAEIHKTDDEITVVGKRLHGGKIKIIPDMIEAGSYLTLGLLPDAEVEVAELPIDDMLSIFDALRSFGAEIGINDNRACPHVHKPKAFSVNAMPYPAFPTDLQPIIAPLMAIYRGGEITDEVWRDRFGYLKTLSAFGVQYSLHGNTAQIYPSKIFPASVSAPDLRGGMACIIAALTAKGQSEIHSAEIVLRGYEDLIKKLGALGADVEIKET